MSTHHQDSQFRGWFANPRWRWRLAALFGLVAAALWGCGGGGGVGTGGTGSFSENSFVTGPVTGFGSVVVNGVRFDVVSASVEDADGVVGSSDDLRLGMTVEVDSAAIVAGSAGALATSKASRIRYASEMVGPVAAIDRVGNALTVLGQRVDIVAGRTVLDGLAGGLAGLAVGDIVEVYADFNAATGRYAATRIDARVSGTPYRLRGVVSALDTGARTLRIGSEPFSYLGATAVPVGLANGSLVRLRLNAATDGAGRLVVQSFGDAAVRLPDADEAKLKGRVTAFTSSQAFSVNGVPVDAVAARFPDGSAGVKLGASVEVEGAARDGVLVAAEVKVESEEAGSNLEQEFEGQITSANAEARTFVLRGVTIATTRSDLRLEGGTLADLKPGTAVEVKGVLSDDGSRVDATQIKFD